jgi:hypothetical protein
MSANLTPMNGKIAIQQKLTDTFYWFGMAMSVLCIAVAWARNTELVGRFEYANFPLSWALGVIAILAFLASEYCDRVSPAENRSAQRVPETLPESSVWETEFVDS